MKLIDDNGREMLARLARGRKKIISISKFTHKSSGE